MNIYNKLFILEYTKTPHKKFNYKYFALDISKNKCYYVHRGFDLYAFFGKHYKEWSQYDEKHRLIGPALINRDYFKSYYIRNKQFKIIDY